MLTLWPTQSLDMPGLGHRQHPQTGLGHLRRLSQDLGLLLVVQMAQIDNRLGSTFAGYE